MQQLEELHTITVNREGLNLLWNLVFRGLCDVNNSLEKGYITDKELVQAMGNTARMVHQVYLEARECQD